MGSTVLVRLPNHFHVEITEQTHRGIPLAIETDEAESFSVLVNVVTSSSPVRPILRRKKARSPSKRWSPPRPSYNTFNVKPSGWLIKFHQGGKICVVWLSWCSPHFTTLPEFWPLRPLLTLGIGRDLQVSSDPQKVTVSAAFALCGSQHVPSAENSRAKNCIS